MTRNTHQNHLSFEIENLETRAMFSAQPIAASLEAPEPAPAISQPLSLRRAPQFATRNDLGVLTRSHTLRGNVDWWEDEQTYTFRLRSAAQIGISLSGLSEDADLQLESGGEVIASSRNGGSNAESIVARLWRGVYTVRVFSYDYEETSFQLRLNRSAAPTIPALNSNPGASHTLYLDFDGDYQSVWSAEFDDFYGVTTPGYGGDTAAMTSIHAAVAALYAPFDVNVTTVAPQRFDDGRALHVVIGGNGDWLDEDGGILGLAPSLGAYNDSFSNTVFVFSGNFPGKARFAIEIANTAAHEAGHAYGLEHFQGDRDAVMGTPDDFSILGPNREAWTTGYNMSGEYQDDVAVLHSVLGWA